ARTQGDEEFQLLRQRDQRGGHQPGVLAGTAGGDQHAAEAEAVGGLGDLREVAVVDGAGAFGGAQVFAVTVGGQEPEDIQTHEKCSVCGTARQPGVRRAGKNRCRVCRGTGNSGCWAMVLGGVQITSPMASFFGISLSAVKVSAMSCWARTTAGVIGLAP